MKDYIRSVDLKVERGKHQANELAKSITVWCKDNKLSVRGEISEDRHKFKLILEEYPSNLPFDEWSITLGEIAHSLRSSLDNLAYALARLKKDPPNDPREISFPIFQKQTDFNKKARIRIKQFPNDALALIQRIQPFNRERPDVLGKPQEDPLVLLQWLNNVDKHQEPSWILLPPKSFEFSQTVHFYSDEDARYDGAPKVTLFADPLKQGNTILEQITYKPIEKVSGQMNIVANVAIPTCQGVIPVPDILNQLTNYTELIVSEFRGFF